MKTPTLRARCLTGIILSLRLVSYYRIITRFPDISPEIGWKNGPFNYTFISEKCTPGKMYTRKIYQALKCTPENCTSGNMYTRKFVHPNFECTFFRVYIFPSVHFSVYNFQGCSRCTIFRVYNFPVYNFPCTTFRVYNFHPIIPSCKII